MGQRKVFGTPDKAIDITMPFLSIAPKSILLKTAQLRSCAVNHEIVFLRETFCLHLDDEAGRMEVG